ncbi:hypothetical protein BDW22DRAFT_1418652 [Trametopsis cervina]|nr:hypothetical protein BDW22DRAFT_1418652 [Trametopsis cervina]
MHDFPTELWLMIIPSACLDDGSTGRALGAVSRRIRAISHEYRYQSIAVTGSRQVQHLIDTLRHPDNVGCRVEALFVEAEDTGLIIQLCSIVAPTVEILTIVTSDTPPESSTRSIDLYFPQLRELTVRGFVILSYQNTLAPALERLELSSNALSASRPFFNTSADNSPNLTYILVHYDEYAVWAQPHPPLLQLLSAAEINMRNNKASSPPLRILAFEFIPMVAQSLDVRQDRELLRARRMIQQEIKQHSRFVLLPEVASGSEVARERWLDRVQGKGGVWALVQTKVRNNVHKVMNEV